MRELYRLCLPEPFKPLTVAQGLKFFEYVEQGGFSAVHNHMLTFLSDIRDKTKKINDNHSFAS